MKHFLDGVSKNCEQTATGRGNLTGPHRREACEDQKAFPVAHALGLVLGVVTVSPTRMPEL